MQRLDRLQQRVAHRTSQERSHWGALQDRRRKCLDALKQAAAVRRAERRLPLAEIVLAARTARCAALAGLDHLVATPPPSPEDVKWIVAASTTRAAAQPW